MLDVIFETLTAQLEALKRDLEQQRLLSQRAETADGVRSYRYADAPRAASGGVGGAANSVSLVWIRDGRKTGEGAGAGTGVLAVYDASIDDYRAIGGSYAVVTV